MTSHLRALRDWPAVPGQQDSPCCMGSALDGPSGCTCWRPVYDLDQQTPDTTLIPEVRATMCGDCAYRPNSPEKSGDPAAAADGEKLRALVADGVPFWCHVGIRRPTHWAHPSGATTPGDPLDYSPPQRGSTPFKADGTPADLCGGWAAQRLKAVAEAAPDQDRRTPS